MLRNLFSLAVLVVLVNALSETEKWQSFKAQFGRSYTHPKEEQTRFAIFRENLQTIESHNALYEQGMVSYKLGINKFADMTKEEFSSWLLGGFDKVNITQKAINFKPSTIDADVPDKINWLDLGAVTGVKDQGSCGSCYSFSATGSMEGQYYLKNKKLVSLSEQNLVDCTFTYGDHGCSGGLMDNAFQYACENGIMSEADYPYIAWAQTCQFDSTKSIVKVSSFVDITSGSESALKTAVGTVGPISVAVDASGMQLYEKGILDYPSCGNDLLSLDHAILAVGYDSTDDGVEYWLVKNSWGEAWGESGYVRMSRNKDNQCGIATAASYPVV